MSSATSLSLLSLSLAAEQSQPLPAPQSNISTPDISTSASRVKPRRLSSASQMRRRMSDAREATIRPALTQSSMSGLSSAAAALSLSPKQSQYAGPTNDARSKDSVTSPTSAPNANYIASGMPAPMPPSNVGKIISHADGLQSINGVPSVGALEERVITGGGKKKGTIFRCESCSKVYRHPSCLVKHRWEHSPHWREASKFLLSKHQQVQLLEAAAILSHITPTAGSAPGAPSTSLPDDRSLWPSFLSSISPVTTGTQAKAQRHHSSGSDEHDHEEDEDAVDEDDEISIDDMDDDMVMGEMEGVPKGPVSSSVPATSLLHSKPIFTPYGSTPYSTGHHPSANVVSTRGVAVAKSPPPQAQSGHSRPGSHTRSRSRSQSISNKKSIHTHTHAVIRGFAAPSSNSSSAAIIPGKKTKRESAEPGSFPKPNASLVGILNSDSNGHSSNTPPPITTFRPGLIGIPTGPQGHAVIGERGIDAQSAGDRDAWNSYRDSPVSSSHTSTMAATSPRDVSAAPPSYPISKGSVPHHKRGSSYSSSFSRSVSASVSLPHSSLRSSSSFTDADEPGSLVEEEEHIHVAQKRAGSSDGDEGQFSNSQARISPKIEEQWDGEDMDMDIGF